MGYIRLKTDIKPSQIQNHGHEVRGYVKAGEENHYHQYAFITANATPINEKDHVHSVYFRTDLVDGHYHEYMGTTLGAVEIGDRHIHYIKDNTTKKLGHSHEFMLVTYVDNPAKK